MGNSLLLVYIELKRQIKPIMIIIMLINTPYLFAMIIYQSFKKLIFILENLF
jgi:hypothetical protein